MNTATDKKPNETYIAYMKRIIDMKSNGRITYTEMADCLIGEENNYSSDNARKAYYFLNKIVKFIDDDYVVTDNDRIAELDRKMEELYKERVKLQDKKREFNKYLMAEARFENLRDTMCEALQHIGTLEAVKEIEYEPKANVEASLILSDLHYGIKISNQFNCYDRSIARERLEAITVKTIHYCKLHRVNTLHICLLGDLINGIINVSNRVEQEEDLITQTMEIADILVKCINKLSEHVPYIQVHTVFGNHSRIFPSKADGSRKDNIERLVYHYLETVLPDIDIDTSDTEDYLIAKIAGKTVVMEHGDKSSNPLVDYTRLLSCRFDEVYRGHYHSFNVQNDNNVTIVTNGSLCGADDYAVQLRKSTKPSQTLRIYDTDVSTYELITEFN